MQNFSGKKLFSNRIVRNIENSLLIKCRHVETFCARCVFECFVAFCCVSLTHEIESVGVVKHKISKCCIFSRLNFQSLQTVFLL